MCIGVTVNLSRGADHILWMNVHLYAGVCVFQCENGARCKTLGVFGVNRCLSLGAWVSVFTMECGCAFLSTCLCLSGWVREGRG